MGRKPNTVKRVSFKSYVDEDLYAQVQVLLTDPMTGRIRYGAITQLLEKLLRRWLQEQTIKHTQQPQESINDK